MVRIILPAPLGQLSTYLTTPNTFPLTCYVELLYQDWIQGTFKFGTGTLKKAIRPPEVSTPWVANWMALCRSCVYLYSWLELFFCPPPGPTIYPPPDVLLH